MTNLIIYCADIGSVKKNNFGWSRIVGAEIEGRRSSGSDIIQLVEASIIRQKKPAFRFARYNYEGLEDSFNGFKTR